MLYMYNKFDASYTMNLMYHINEFKNILNNGYDMFDTMNVMRLIQYFDAS